MKVPLTWLKEFVPVGKGAEEFARRLTLGGLEVEEILDVGGEKVLEVNVTPNRGDCLSIFGVSREAGALFGVSVRRPKVPQAVPSEGKPAVPVEVRDRRKCPRYTLALLSGLRVAPSPDWLVRRLEAAGIRCVNNVVDVTNYVMIESGQPLHVFDRKKLRGGITVRRAKGGEKILTLDGEERELIEDDLVIADREGPIALAGIMGGKDSEIDPETTEVALESAFFDSASVRRTSRRLGLMSESSYRFERRVDPEGVRPALLRAAGLLKELAGGEPAGPVIDVFSSRLSGRKIRFNPDLVSSRLGVRWATPVIRRALTRLSFSVRPRGKSQWEVSVPSHRGDVFRPEDLIEEVLRFSGMDKIPASFPPLVSPPSFPDPRLERERRLRILMSDLGFHEAIHLSFLSSDEVSLLDPSLVENAVTLQNPLGTEYSVMRPSLLPSLLKTVAYHHNHKIFDVHLFEIGKRFFREGGKVKEELSAAGIVSGPGTDFFDIKGVMERILKEFQVENVSFAQGGVPILHPMRQAVLKTEKEILGRIGEIHPDLQERLGLKRVVMAFELDWERLVSRGRREGRFEEFSRHPLVERDLAVVVDEEIAAGPIIDFIRSHDPAVREARLFDVYRGAPVPPGRKSIAFAIRMGRKGETMTEEEVNTIFGRLVEKVKHTFRADIR